MLGLRLVAVGLLSWVGCAPDSPVSPGAARLRSAEARVPRLLRFSGVVSPAQRRALAEQGVELLERRGRGVWLGRGPDHALRLVEGREGVESVAAIPMAEKLGERLRAQIAQPAQEAISAWVLLADAEAAALTELQASGCPGRRVGFAPIFEVHCSSGDLARLAEKDAVRFVDVAPGPPIPELDRSRQAIGVESLQAMKSGSPPVYELAGAGTKAGIWDARGVDPNHQDFAGRLLRYPDPKLSSSLVHGTTVAGCVAGSGARSGVAPHPFAPYQIRGMAPEAKLAFYLADKEPDSTGQPIPLNVQYAEAVKSHDLDVANFSYSYSSRTIYDATSANFDYLLARRDPTLPEPLPFTVAVGNYGEEGYGSVTSLAAAKDILTVGATDWSTSGLASISSFGPTTDGRIKPEVLAPGHSTHGKTHLGLDRVRLIPTSGTPVEWTFDADAQGWTAVKDTSAPSVSGGVLETTTSGDDPLLVGPDQLSLAATSYTKAEITLRSDRHHAAVLVWKTASADFSSNRFPFLINADGALHTYELDLSTRSTWKGTIQQIGLVPFAAGLALPISNNTYGIISGTSLSSPIVAGGVLLLTQAWRQLPGASKRPTPAMVKALLVGTARDLVVDGPVNPKIGGPTPCTAGPDFASGYGEVDLARAVSLVRAAGKGPRPFIEGTIADTGDSVVYRLRLSSPPAGSLSLTLAWDDPPATPGSTGILQNDLDLEVQAPGGAVTLPWVLDPKNPKTAATRGVDRVNNLEQVTLPAPVAGDYLVTVSGHELAKGPQPFALALSDATGLQSFEISGPTLSEPTRDSGVPGDKGGAQRDATLDGSPAGSPDASGDGPVSDGGGGGGCSLAYGASSPLVGGGAFGLLLLLGLVSVWRRGSAASRSRR